jgi:hypothetical protein
LAGGRAVYKIDDHDSLLNVAHDEVHVSIVRLEIMRRVTGIEKRVLTCKMPVSSRSPLSLTKTRSLRERRMRSNGSWIDEDGSIEFLE